MLGEDMEDNGPGTFAGASVWHRILTVAAGPGTFQGFLAKVNYANPPTDEQIVAKCPAKCMSVDPHFETGN